MPFTAKLPLPVAAPIPAEHARASVLVVGPFVDARKDRGRCGMKKNGYNGDAADILCAQPPATFLARRLAADLRAVGVDVREPPEDADVRIEGTLLQFFTEAKASVFTVEMETDVHVRLTATATDGLVADREIFVKGSDSSGAPDDDVIQASVDDASAKIARTMSMSVLALLDQRAKDRATGAP